MAKVPFGTNVLAKLLEGNKCHRHDFLNALSYFWGHGAGPHKLFGSEPLAYYKCHMYVLLPCSYYVWSYLFRFLYCHPSPLYSAQKSLIISTVYKMKFRFLMSSGSTNTATACPRHQLPLQTSFFVLPASIEAMLHSPYHMPYYVSSVSLLSLISTWDQISLTFIAHLKHFVVPLWLISQTFFWELSSSSLEFF